MTRLIDADELRKDILDMPNCYNGFSDTYDKAMIVDMIDEQPSVDAVPVRHGKWIEEIGMFMCSECGDAWSSSDAEMIHVFNYCPNCGADMRGENDG